MMSRRRNRPGPPAPRCKNHPNQPAISGTDLCKNCKGWQDLNLGQTNGPPKKSAK